MPVLHITLFGGLALHWDQDPTPPISSAVARSLLAYLVTYRDRAHTRDLLAGTFWPDLPDAVARRRLSRALWQIRHALQLDHPPDPILLTTGDTVQLNPDLPLWLDVAEFERRVAGGKSQALELAIELYRGDFLAGYYDDWLLVERERLRELFLATLERLTEGYKGQGEYERALAHARQLATEAPWREETQREVMRLCHLLGQDAEALKQFEVCRQVLAQELDAEPSPETVTLAREIAEYSEQVSVPDLPQAPSHPGAIVLDSAEAIELPLVGREQERAELLAHVQALFQGLGGLVLVEGEAGVGKTRLLQTLARDAEWRGAEVLWGEAQEVEVSIPYGPLAEALAEGLSPLRASQLEQLVDRIWLQVLSNLLPCLATWLPDLPPAPQIDPAQERDRLVSAVTHFLAGWRRVKPLVVVLENLHWSGEDTLDLLARLAPSLRERGVLLVGSYRGEDARALPGVWEKLQVLDRAGVQQRLVLSGLDAAGTGELVRRCLGLGTPVPLFETRLYGETEGNPLFVLETLRALHGEGLLTRDASGQWRTPWDETTSDYGELPLPRAVEGTIARRLAFLSPALQQMVHLASVLGERFEFGLLLAASDQESPGVLAALGELVQRRFLDETERDYRFSHDKIRQVAYEGLESPERLLLHRQAAQALEAIQPEQIATLAHHWTRAEVWGKAANYHRQAGERAQAAYANAEATTHYTRALEALEHLDEPPDKSQVFALRSDREKLYHIQGDRKAQAQDLTALESLAEALADGWRQAEVALRQAHYANATGDYPAAAERAQAATQLARAAQDINSEAASYLLWGQALWREGSYEAARPRLEQALALAQSGQLSQTPSQALDVSAKLKRARTMEADSLKNLGTVFWYLSDFAKATTYYEQALTLYREIGDRTGEGNSLNNLGNICAQQGDYTKAKTYYDLALGIYREVGDRYAECNLLNNLGNIFDEQGHYRKAGTWYEQALRISREIGYRFVEIRALGNLSFVATHLNDYARARTYSEQALDICRETGDREGECWVLSKLAHASMYLGDYARARVCLEQALSISRDIAVRWNESSVLGCLGLVSHLLGENETAREYCQQALLIAQEIGDPPTCGYVLTYLAHALVELGCLAEATDAYREARDIRRELGKHSLAMESLAGLPRISLIQGDQAQAQAYVEEILSYLENNSLGGADEPLRVYLTCYQVLDAVQDPRALDVLAAAYDLLQEQAARIPDEGTRRSFLENVAAHREIVAAHRELQGRRINTRLPCADAPAGRPLRDDEYTTVIWTVNAPGDKKIPRKTERRRHRILRLVREAQAQDAAPRDQDLATALGVSLVTIRRDVVALRAEGYDLPTRGRK